MSSGRAMKGLGGMAAGALVLMPAGAWALQGQDAPRPRRPLAGAEAAKVSPGDVAVAAADTFKGTVHATMTRKIPRLNASGAEYDLSATADASVKDTLAKISKGEATGRYVVKGPAGGGAISVVSISPE